MCDSNGKDTMMEKGGVVAGNEAIHAKLLKLLKAAGASASAAAKAAPAKSAVESARTGDARRISAGNMQHNYEVARPEVAVLRVKLMS